MKDKIVVAPHQIDDYDLDIQSVGHNGAEEYIRKDALLEWAKETYLSENASAIRKVCFKQLVEKLMSM